MRTLSGEELLRKLLQAARSNEATVSLSYSTSHRPTIWVHITDIAGERHIKTFRSISEALDFARSLGEVRCEYQHAIFERELGGEA